MVRRLSLEDLEASSLHWGDAIDVQYPCRGKALWWRVFFSAGLINDPWLWEELSRWGVVAPTACAPPHEIDNRAHCLEGVSSQIKTFSLFFLVWGSQAYWCFPCHYGFDPLFPEGLWLLFPFRSVPFSSLYSMNSEEMHPPSAGSYSYPMLFHLKALESCVWPSDQSRKSPRMPLKGSWAREMAQLVKVLPWMRENLSLDLQNIYKSQWWQETGNSLAITQWPAIQVQVPCLWEIQSQTNGEMPEKRCPMLCSDIHMSMYMCVHAFLCTPVYSLRYEHMRACVGTDRQKDTHTHTHTHTHTNLDSQQWIHPKN
jgi:hypothetical protein